LKVLRPSPAASVQQRLSGTAAGIIRGNVRLAVQLRIDACLFADPPGPAITVSVPRRQTRGDRTSEDAGWISQLVSACDGASRPTPRSPESASSMKEPLRPDHSSLRLSANTADQLRSGAPVRLACGGTGRHLSLQYGCRPDLRQLHPLVRRPRTPRLAPSVVGCRVAVTGCPRRRRNGTAPARA
jgi:hypothetical protein